MPIRGNDLSQLLSLIQLIERTLPLWLLNQLNRPRDVPVTNVVALCVMCLPAIPILGAYYLTKSSEDVEGAGK